MKFHKAVLEEILDERVASSRKRRGQRGVKRKMSNYSLRRGYKRSPLIDICAAIRIVKRRVLELGAVQIFLIQIFLLVIEVDRLALDKQHLDLTLRFQRIAIDHQQIGPLTFFDGPDLVAYTPDICRIFGNCPDRIVVRQTKRHGLSGLVGQVA